MLSSRSRHAISLSLLALTACGGGSSEKAASPTSAPNAGGDKHESIGALAAEQGGLAALGGAGNREEGGGTEVAFAGPLRAETLSKKNPPKLDGVVKEWHLRSPAKETISGSTDGLGLDVAVQTGDDTLWIAAEIADGTLTRTGKFGEHEDHVTLTIAFPSGRGALKAYEVGFWPGVPGSSPGVVKWTAGPRAGQKVAGAKIVENDVKGGVTFEATIPWASFPEAQTVRVGMRAAFRYHDGDGSRIAGVLGTGGGSVDKPNDLPALPIAAERRSSKACWSSAASPAHVRRSTFTPTSPVTIAKNASASSVAFSRSAGRVTARASSSSGVRSVATSSPSKRTPSPGEERTTSSCAAASRAATPPTTSSKCGRSRREKNR
jgi:hypothetical protein